MGILDYVMGNYPAAGAPVSPNDPSGAYLGGLMDPNTATQFQAARSQAALNGLAAGFATNGGASRLPVTDLSVLGGAIAGMNSQQNALPQQALQAAETQSQVSDAQMKRAQVQMLQQQIARIPGLMQAFQNFNNMGNGGASNQPITSGTVSNQGSAPGGVGGAPSVSSTTADTTMQPAQRAFLDTIAGPESSGAYNVRWGGPGKSDVTFDSYAAHPGIMEPGPQGPSSAAGRYQIVKSTWDPLQKNLNLPDFSPVSQDQAAWNLASTTYAKNTNRDLLTDLNNGRTQDVGPALAGQWATLNRAMPSYAANLQKYLPGGSAAAGGGAATPNNLPAVPNFAGRMAGAEGSPYAPGLMPAATAGGTPSVAPTGSAGVPGAAPGAGGIVPPSMPVNNPSNVTLASYSPAEVALAKQRGMMMNNGLPSFPPGAAKPQSQSAANPNPTFYAPTPMSSQEAANDRVAYASPGAFGGGPPSTGLMPAAAAGTPPMVGAAAPQQQPAQQPIAQTQQPAPAQPQGPVVRMPNGPPAGAMVLPFGVTPEKIAAAQNLVVNSMGMPEMFQPPQYIKDIAGLAPALAKASGEAWAKVGPDLYTKYNSPMTVRPGGVVGTPAGGPMWGNPSLQQTVDPNTGEKSFTYMMPPMVGGGAAALQAPGPVGGAPSVVPPMAGGSQQAPQAQTSPSVIPGTTLRGNLGLPPQGAAPGATGMVSGLGPGTEEALKTRAKAEQDQRQKVIDDGNAANDSNATLMAMQNEVGNFATGPFASHIQDAAKYLRLIDSSYDGQVASYEDFVKNAGALTRKAVREVSGRAAVQEFNMVQNSLPNPEMSPQGLQRVTNELSGLNKYKLFKSQAQDAWEQSHGGIGNVQGFETDFQKQVSPYAFVVANMAPEDRQAFAAKMNSTKQGQQQLGVLTQQLHYINGSGLYQ